MHSFQQTFRQTFWLLLALCFFLFWARAFITGERGYLAWRDMTAEIHRLETELDRLGRENQQTEARIRSLSPQSVDLDYLGERIRQQIYGRRARSTSWFCPAADRVGTVGRERSAR